MDIRIFICLLAAGTALALSSCAPQTTATKASGMSAADPFDPVRETSHRNGDDLLTAGLGLDGLRAMTGPAVSDPDAPTAAELRRRAIWANWRGIADLRPGGGAGDDLPTVPGREFSALATLPGAQHPHRVLLQLPDSFDPDKPCLVVAPASGSRGVYGAIAVAAPWALPRGCAVVYTDKGAGSDYVELHTGQGVALDGTLAGPGEPTAFSPDTAATGGVAFKHAHSQDNPEADWGQHVRQAAEFGLEMLSRSFPRHHRFSAANTRIIAVGISNGGGAVLRAAEAGDDLLDGIVAGEPNVFVDAPDARPLYDYATLAARLMPCAVLNLDGRAPVLQPEALHALGELRCESLAARGELQGTTREAQIADARAQLRAAGFDGHALRGGGITAGFDLWRAVAAPYASAYGRFGAGEHVCGYDFAVLDDQGARRDATVSERALWWSDASGIPPGNGIALLDARLAGSDPLLPGLDCLRELWTGTSDAADKVRQGVAATRADLPREGLPVIVVHGRDDGLIPPVFSSMPYVRMAQDAGRNVAYWLVDDAQHFDAFLGLPGFADRYVPLLPTVHAALDALWAHLDQPGQSLPAHPPR